jgi:uncharacterized HhH-GPD family protein
VAVAAPERLYFTGDDEADALIAKDPLALLIGFALDQQVSVEKAFSSPLELKRRLGTLDPETIARTDPATLEEIFRRKPALHRYPGAMAQRVQDLTATIVEEYGGHAERVWTDAADGADLKRRLAALPGFGDMKVRSMLAVLAKRFGVRLEGLDEVLPQHPTLGDVDSNESRQRYQEAKRAYKARMKAQQSS